MCTIAASCVPLRVCKQRVIASARPQLRRAAMATAAAAPAATSVKQVILLFLLAAATATALDAPSCAAGAAGTARSCPASTAQQVGAGGKAALASLLRPPGALLQALTWAASCHPSLPRLLINRTMRRCARS